jgi:hypothetical protein
MSVIKAWNAKNRTTNTAASLVKLHIPLYIFIINYGNQLFYYEIF